MLNNLDSYPYFVLLKTRGSELKGLKSLTDDQKDLIMPVISLGHWRKSPDVDKSLEKIQEAFGERPFILDLSKEPQYQNQAILDCLDSTNFYSKWTDLVLSLDNVVPVIQFDQRSKQRDVIRQSIRFENADKNPIFKITNFVADRRLVIPALASLESPENALVIIDAGYIRHDMSSVISKGVVASVVDTINRIRDEVPEAIIVVASTSFPRTVMPFTQDAKYGEIQILEWDLFESLGPDVALYGDHGSIHSVIYDRSGGTWAPRIDYIKERTWVFERRVGDNAGGYPAAASALVKNFPEISDSQQWGDVMISNTSEGKEPAIKAATTNIAVRVNLHIQQQLSYLTNGPVDDEDLDW